MYLLDLRRGCQLTQPLFLLSARRYLFASY
jgi:hypothetical protein